MFQGMGGQADAATGCAGRVAQGAGHMALPGAHLLLPRHHGPDARGGTQVGHTGRNRRGIKCCCFRMGIPMGKLFFPWQPIAIGHKGHSRRGITCCFVVLF